MSKKDKIIIGRSEHVSFPEFGFKLIKAKIDTGAFTSSIHCHKIRVIKSKSTGKLNLKFELLDPSHPLYEKKTLKVKDFKQKIIKSSNGSSRISYIIKTKIELFGKSFDTEFSLTDRSEMKHPVLLGRKFLNKGFLVDVTLYDLSLKSEHSNYKIVKVKKSK
ncbi:MAG: hypothetical protein EBR67_05405 [Proteobacteria bacterium]|nr:hypothetical protein [Pseudomonadota bacterium]